MYAALRDLDPVHYVDDGDYWVLTRFEDVFAAARNTATFSSAQGLTMHYDDREMAGLEEVAPIVMMDPPEHTAFRRLLSRGFTPRQVSDIEGDIRSFVVERVERLRQIGSGDVVAELFKPLPSFVVAHYLGVDEVDRDRFDGWTQAIVAASAEGDPLAASGAVGELFEFFTEMIERRRLEPGDDTISLLVEAADGDPGIPVLQVLGFAFTMVTGGNDTSTGLLGGAAELLTAWPDQRAILLDDLLALPNAIDELLRLTSPVQNLARTVTEDVTIRGERIPCGRKVLLSYGAANRDPREFGDDAEVLDVTRAIRHHLAFSSGAHYCLGAAAARLQARIALEELLCRCPDFGVDADAGAFAGGNFVRRYESLPFQAG